MLRQRNIGELLNLYRDYVLSKVSKVRILGEEHERDLKDVFVELSLVDHRPPRHAEFLGMMDSEMRKRFNPFDKTHKDNPSPELFGREKKTTHPVKPDELLRRRTKAIITGAPGCGKTTLLKYLALRAQETGELLVVWLELKAIGKPLFAQAEEAAAQDGHLILQELWLKYLKAQLSLCEAEIHLCRDHWQEKLKANEIAVLLDGFDELQDEGIEGSLNKCVREFASGVHDNTLLISTRPYAEHKVGTERLQELEIQPLTQHQIEAFLDCYYPNDPATMSLLRDLRERSSLRELLHLPLLLGVILRLHKENTFTDERLTLYKTIVSDLVHKLDRSKSVNRRFKISDERLRLDFLKFLAFERLLRDSFDEKEQEVHRIVFNHDLLREKAQIFLARECSSHSARDLADDALATPLLRGLNADTFAFSHLTLQEYLASQAFASFYETNEHEGLTLFCRAYHNPIIAEMEVLPMMLGALNPADKLYDEIKNFSDSLSLIGLRLRLRSLSYKSNIDQKTLSVLIDELEEQLLENRISETLYCDLVADSLSGVHGDIESYLGERIARLLADQDNSSRWRAASALGLMRSSTAIHPLMAALDDKDEFVRAKASEALGRIRGDRALTTLVKRLGDANNFVRWNAATALAKIRNSNAVEPLLGALATETDDYARGGMIDALGELGDERAIDALSLQLKQSNEGVGWHASEALVKIGGRGISELLRSVIGDDDQIRWSAFTALPENLLPEFLEELGEFEIAEHLLAGTPYNCLVETGEKTAVHEILALTKALLFGQMLESDAVAAIKSSAVIVPGLLKALQAHDAEVRAKAAEALGIVEDQRAVFPLINALQDDETLVREKATEALGELKSALACDALADALDDKDQGVRKQAAKALGACCKDQSHPVVDKLAALTSHERDHFTRWNAITSLGEIGGEKAAFILFSVLLFNRMSADKERAIEYLSSVKHSDLRCAMELALYADNALLKSKAAKIVGYYTADSRVLERLNLLSQSDPDSSVRNATNKAAEKLVRKLELLNYFVTSDASQPSSDNESLELLLVGEAFRIAAEAGHIFRPTANSDWGIDGEIEFKDEKGQASGKRVYLQLKSGDSHLRKRKSDGKETFTIKNPRHVEYWQSHAYPVFLVIRDSVGRIRWMNITDYLRRHGPGIGQVDFEGEPFNAESVNKMRVSTN
jgi:HEAT repeat protein